MVNVKRGHKLCEACKSSYKTKCKYPIQKYKTASKYMKLKTIEYLIRNKNKNISDVVFVMKLFQKIILIVMNISKCLIQLYQFM